MAVKSGILEIIIGIGWVVVFILSLVGRMSSNDFYIYSSVYS